MHAEKLLKVSLSNLKKLRTHEIAQEAGLVTVINGVDESAQALQQKHNEVMERLNFNKNKSEPIAAASTLELMQNTIKCQNALYTTVQQSLGLLPNHQKQEDKERDAPRGPVSADVVI